MWVETYRGQLVNLDHYHLIRIDVADDECSIVARGPEGEIVLASGLSREGADEALSYLRQALEAKNGPVISLK